MGYMFGIYFLTTVLSGGLTLLCAHSLLELSDLDCNFTNTQKCCVSLNSLVVPEILFMAILVALHSLTLNWIFLSLNLPMLIWLIYLYRSSKGYSGLYDITELSDHRVMNSAVQRLVFKIIFHLLHFFAYVYLAIISLITL